MNKPSLSIVMAVYNRQDLLDKTLNSFKHHGYASDVQVVIVDDASANPVVIDKGEYHFQIDLKRISLNEKKHVNPCIPYNIGIEMATAPIVILQNPECFHLNNIKENLIKEPIANGCFRSFACYSLSESELIDFSVHSQQPVLQKFAAPNDGESGWYNHSVYRPMAYHFCNAYHSEDLFQLGGFDVAYANGRNYDDEEFKYRAINYLGLRVEYSDSNVVLHQWHRSGGVVGRLSYASYKNGILFRLYTKKRINLVFVRTVLAPLLYLPWLVFNKFFKRG